MSSEEAYNTIVVGGGQSGLAAGYYLSQRGEKYLILDENERTGETWRQRWDSLRLFTPSQNDCLPGMKFPGSAGYFPTKDEAAQYLEAYRNKFQLPVRYGVKVDGLQRNSAGYHISAGDSSLHTRNVVIATGAFNTPYTPSIAQQLDKGVIHMHSTTYRSPASMPASKVMVVGAGNSGAEIAIELAKAGKKVWLAGRDVGQAPGIKLRKVFSGRLNWFIVNRIMTVNTPMGRRLRAQVIAHGGPLVRTQREDVRQAGVELVPRLTAVKDGLPILEDGQVLPAEGVIWVTGFHPDYDWIHLPVFDDRGHPRHKLGVASDAPGLFFLGLLFQRGLASALLGGVGEDAKYVVGQVGRSRV